MKPIVATTRAGLSLPPPQERERERSSASVDLIRAKETPDWLGNEHAPIRPAPVIDQDLWPSASQVRRLASFGASVSMTLNTSASPFCGAALDSMISTDCTDWWSHLR